MVLTDDDDDDDADDDDDVADHRMVLDACCVGERKSQIRTTSPDNQIMR